VACLVFNVKLKGKAFVPLRILALLLSCCLAAKLDLALSLAFACADAGESHLAVDGHLVDKCR
jgi:hypothetical protein